MNDKQILTQISKAAQMGQYGIQSVMPYASQPALRQALKYQRKEYASIQQEAMNLAKRKGYHLESLGKIPKAMAGISARSHLLSGDRNSKIAGMMIQGSTRGVIESLQNAGKWNRQDAAVEKLAQKMLQTQQYNIDQLKGFL